MFQFNPLKTSGNQKWNGALPNFKSRADLITINSNNWNLDIKSLEAKKITTEKRNKDDPKTWVIKYFKTLSVGYLLLLFLSKGISDKRLISNPIQEANNEFAEIAIKVLEINDKEKNIL